MNLPNLEFLFPPRFIPFLHDLRDTEWAKLIDDINESAPYEVKRLAIELIIVRWSGCVNCQADSFRAMQGCVQCTIQAVRRYRGSSSDLDRLITDAMREIEDYVNKKP